MPYIWSQNICNLTEVYPRFHYLRKELFIHKNDTKFTFSNLIYNLVIVFDIICHIFNKMFEKMSFDCKFSYFDWNLRK